MSRLVYVIGPSGAGKDSVLAALRARWPDAPAAHWARRSISRPVQPGGEQHEALEATAFPVLQAMGAFALHWQANGLHYGVRHEELQPLARGRWVFVNGSRGHLRELLRQWPQATIVHLSASPAVLAARLGARGREDAQAVAARLAREVPLQLPPGSISVRNDGALDEAVHALERALLD